MKIKRFAAALTLSVLFMCILWGCSPQGNNTSGSSLGQPSQSQSPADQASQSQSPADQSSQAQASQAPQAQASQAPQAQASQAPENGPSAISWSNMKVSRSMKLLYADQFAVDYYEGGCSLITIKDSGRYLVVPEHGAVPKGLPEDVEVIRQPLKNIYLVATSAMDLFHTLGSVNQITLSGTTANGWYIDEAKQAMEDGKMLYAGKYNAPDYERILSSSCDLAIENTMIYHAPEVKAQLEKMGVPVLVERSSYERQPLGRMEWLKLYGVLLGKEDLAESYFSKEIKALEPVMNQKSTGKTVAFFYITSNGSANVRKPWDYMAKMISIAGGTYVPQNIPGDDNALSTMNMQMEAFYASVKNADYIIYNSTIDGELKSLDELIAKNGLFADFKAVKEGHVWCTRRDMFQETMGLGNMIQDMHRMLTQEKPDPGEMTYLYRLQ